MIIYLGRRLLAASSSIPGAGRVAPVRLLCLAPGGGCLAADITARAGGLLHHRFTLAALRTAIYLSVALFRRVTPPGC